MKKITLAAIACICTLSLAALPELKVSTKNNVKIDTTSKAVSSYSQATAKNCLAHLIFNHKYTAATSITLTDPSNSANNISVSGTADSIRGRGNSTWAGDKKPYRIKFAEHQSMFGKTKKHKSWALLANWYDQTFALNALGFELGKRIGIPGTPNQFLVDFYLNNEYKGIYQITDIVQVNKGRLEIDEKDGWLVEFDYHCPSDPDEVDFATDYPNTNYPSAQFLGSAKLHTFIKSPEDLSSSSGYDFVKREVNNLTTTMFNKSGFPENGYRELVDLESVAKYLMLEQFLDNYDFNNKSQASGFPASNFFHKDKGGKIKAGPIWDLDLTGGVENKTFPKHFTTYQTPIKPNHVFYQKFFDDPVFLAKLKKNWDKYKPDIQAMSKQGGFIDSIAAAVEGSVVKNFALQIGSISCNPTCTPGKGGGFSGQPPIALGNLQAYKDEVAKLKTWWNNRVKFFDDELTKMKIDISKDIVDPPSSSSSSSKVSSSSISSSSFSSSSSSSRASSSSVGVSSSSSRGSSSSSNNIISSSSEATTHILLSQNLPQGTKIEVYNLQGKLVYSGYSENPKILKIGVQTKGVYIIRVKQGNSTSAYQNRIYLN